MTHERDGLDFNYRCGSRNGTRNWLNFLPDFDKHYRVCDDNCDPNLDYNRSVASV